MTRIRTAVLYTFSVGLLLLLMTACGGDDDSPVAILSFPDQDVSEQNYRAYLRAAKAQDGAAWSPMCSSLNGLSGEAALNYFRNLNPTDDIPPVAGATPRPGQRSNSTDMLRAASIVQDECRRAGMAAAAPQVASASTTLDATGVLQALKKAGLPIGDYMVYDAKTDPNELLGRPGQYVAKANFRDNRLTEEGSQPFDSADGGSVEIFASTVDAERRQDYIARIGQNLPFLVEYHYREGVILLRVSKRLIPEDAAKYGNALKTIKTP